MECKRLVGGVGYITVPCQLRARRAVLAEAASRQSTSPASTSMTKAMVRQSDIFIMNFRADGAGSNAGYRRPGTRPRSKWRGRVVFRYKSLAPQISQNQLFVLDAFPRACRSGFIIGRFNADTGASWIGPIPTVAAAMRILACAQV